MLSNETAWGKYREMSLSCIVMTYMDLIHVGIGRHLASKDVFTLAAFEYVQAIYWREAVF